MGATVQASPNSSGTIILDLPSITLPDSTSYVPFAVGTPLLVSDGASEVVTPTAVNCSFGAPTPCTITANFAYAHSNRAQVSSATYGLQEAVNNTRYSGGGSVIITPDWPGTSGQLNSISGANNVTVRDQRNGGDIWYGWNGTQYVQVFSLNSGGAGVGSMNISGTLSAKALNGCRSVDAVNYSTIQPAISDAGSSGCVVIPPTYAGTDSYTNPNGVRIYDLRRGVISDRALGYISVGDFGAKMDGQWTHCSSTAGSTTLTCTGNFTSGDAGKSIRVYGAGTGGNNVYVGSIASVTSGTTLTLSAATPTAGNNLLAFYATDDTNAVLAAINWVSGSDNSGANHAGNIYIPFPVVVTSTILIKNKAISLGCNSTGGRIDVAPLSSFIMYNGPAGQSVLKFQDAMGSDFHDCKVIANSSNKALAYLEINQSNGGQTQRVFSAQRLWLGPTWGEPDFVYGTHQATNGILWSGTINEDSNQLRQIHITNTDNAINSANPNAGDTQYDGLYMFDQQIGINMAAGGQVFNNVFFATSTVSDIYIGPTSGAEVVIDYMQSENSYRMAKFDPSCQLCHLVVRGGGWQASSTLASDGIWLDDPSGGVNRISLTDFNLRTDGSAPPAQPVLRDYNTGGGVTNSSLFLRNTRGIYPGGMNLGSVLADNDTRRVVYEPAPEYGQDDLPWSHVVGDWNHTGDRSFQTFRNDFPGKVNVYGGEFRVDQLQPPGTISCGQVGVAGTTAYYYKVTAVTYAGETLPSSECTVSNGNATLSTSNYNQVSWHPVNGAYALKIYRGTSSGNEQYIATVTWDSMRRGCNPCNAAGINAYNDTGGTASGALPTVNTTGSASVEGSFTIGTTSNAQTFSNSATAPRTVTLPDANTVTVQPSSASAGQFATGVTSAGVITYGTPALPLAGTSGSIGGASVAAGTCATGTTTVTGSTTSMPVAVGPNTYPGDGFDWSGYVSSAGTVTVRVCNRTALAATPTASTYNIRVIQ